MSLFAKTATEYIVQIVELAKKTKKRASKGDSHAAKRLLGLILKFDKKELEKIGDETGSEELLNACKQVHSLTQEALTAIKRGDVDKAQQLLDSVINLESHEILAKVKRYQEIKAELRKRAFDIDKITDRLGFGIDKLIKPLVATLTHLGFRTEHSCQGHADRGDKHPGVQLQANSHFRKLVRVVDEYNRHNRVTWRFEKFSNPSTFTSTVGITRPERRELSKSEIDFITTFCKKVIRENNLDLAGGNQGNFCIVVKARKGTHSEDLRTFHSLVNRPLSQKGYEVSMNIPKDTNVPDTYTLYAHGGSLKQMQHDIIHFSDFLMRHPP